MRAAICAAAILAALGDVQAGEAAASTPATLADLLATVQANVVAIEVERTEDIDRPRRGRRGRRSGTAREYFQRPEEPVSGLLIDTEGHVLTSNYNVAGKLESVRVVFGGRSFDAEVLGRSVRDDLALLRINEDGRRAAADAAKPLRWRKEPLRAGQFLFAIGRSPDPQRPTITRGIVSAAARNGSRAVQTDAELNYGNAGGPLVDLDGNVAAIASFVGHHQPQWGINSGVGFGTTAKTVREILPALKKGERIGLGKQTRLGVYWDSSSFAERGARVREVADGSGAEKAGLRPGDVILAIDDAEIETFNQLRRVIYYYEPGQVIRIRLLRDDKTIEVEATLGEGESR